MAEGYINIKPMIEENKNDRQEELMRLNEIRVRVREEGIDPLEFPKGETDKMFILNCLKNHFIFYNLSEKELDNVKDSMFLAEFPPAFEVFRQGTIGSCFYVIQKGAVEIRVDEEFTK
jgi:cGMP-dependent protein kinase